MVDKHGCINNYKPLRMNIGQVHKNDFCKNNPSAAGLQPITFIIINHEFHCWFNKTLSKYNSGI